MTEALSGGTGEICTHTAKVHSLRMLLTLRSQSGYRGTIRTFIAQFQRLVTYC